MNGRLVATLKCELRPLTFDEGKCWANETNLGLYWRAWVSQMTRLCDS